MSPVPPAELAVRFRHFAEKECHDSSPLYVVLALTVAGDGKLIELAGHCRAGQPPANLLFAAVHDLLLRDIEHPLRSFYAEFGGPVRAADAAGPFFRDFCLRCWDEIVALVAVRLVQTNEVRRCVYVQAAFAQGVGIWRDRPLALIEIGPSAALNLCWDHYGYGPEAGMLGQRPDAPVRLTTEWRGGGRPPAWNVPPAIIQRHGVDLNVINLDDRAERRWLEALIWPEHADRRQRLQQAVETVRRVKPQVQQGDAAELLPGLLAAVPPAALPCIYHTHVANQMTARQRAKLLQAVGEAGQTRDLCHVHNDIQPHLHLTRYDAGRRHDLPLAQVDAHARWVEWIAG